MSKTIEVNKEEIMITHPEKIFFPQDNLTKLDIVNFYHQISGHILPYLKDRIITMQRTPNGIDGKSFYQKKAARYFPEWVERIKIPVKEGKEQLQIICQNPQTLVYLAHQAVITPHIWLSQKNDLNKPDKLIFDLDPPTGDFGELQDAALALNEKFEEMQVPNFVMTTGSKGLHVIIPLKPIVDFDRVRDYAKHIALNLANRYPQKFTVEIRKNKREGKVFLDYLRNSYAQTSVAPYSLRAKKGAPVATPISWQELKSKNGKLNSQSFNYFNIFERLKNQEDPWRDFCKKAVDLRKFF
jgi:bifunctional non-homologous end joining protein LigD